MNKKRALQKATEAVTAIVQAAKQLSAAEAEYRATDEPPRVGRSGHRRSSDGQESKPPTPAD